jgi:hypothetical protein
MQPMESLRLRTASLTIRFFSSLEEVSARVPADIPILRNRAYGCQDAASRALTPAEPRTSMVCGGASLVHK